MHLRKNDFAATNNIKAFTTFILIILSSNVFAASTNNKTFLAFISEPYPAKAGAFSAKIMLDSYLTDNFQETCQQQHLRYFK